jgi:dihydroorotate dehydrogenase (fumarate)
MELVPNLHLSTSADLLLRLRWLSILSGRLRASLAASGGVHYALDGLKAVLTGAHAVQLVSAILQHGPQHFRVMEEGLRYWMARHECASVDQVRGRLSSKLATNPAFIERSNYRRVLQAWGT